MFRTRRLRKTENIRRLVRENKLSVDDFIYPLFIEEGTGIVEEWMCPGKAVSAKARSVTAQAKSKGCVPRIRL